MKVFLLTSNKIQHFVNCGIELADGGNGEYFKLGLTFFNGLAVRRPPTALPLLLVAGPTTNFPLLLVAGPTATLFRRCWSPDQQQNFYYTIILQASASVGLRLCWSPNQQ